MTTVERERVVVAAPAKTDELLDVLVNAREMVAKGWCQGDYREGGSVCMVGALLYSNGYGFDDDFKVELLRDAEKALVEAIGCECGLISWNDRRGRTRGEVLAAFDEAIAARKGRVR